MSEQGRVITERFDSQVLRGNALGDPTTRDLCVYLPPGYDESGTARFPVVYCLTGFTGRGKMLLNDQPFAPNLAQRIDKLIATAQIQPLLAVMPDCFTRLGGSQYINSSATGAYEDYLVREIVPFIDAKYRTLAHRDARAVMGKSSGGYGALIHALRNADVFGLAAAHSGDCYFEHCYMMDFAKACKTIAGDPTGFIEKFWRHERKDKSDVPTLNIIGMSACYAPDPESPLGFQLPFHLQTGEIRTDIWQRWLEHDPVRLVARHAEALRSMRLLYLDAGTRDEFALDLGARIFCAQLRAHSIEYFHEEYDDGHFNVSYRYERSLTMISQALAR